MSDRELPEVRVLRMKLKAARQLLRDLAIACAQADDALERAHRNPQPEEAQHDHEERQRTAV